MKTSDLPAAALLDELESGRMSRRRFHQVLGAMGVSMVAAPILSRSAQAAAVDQATYFTWGGWDLPELYADYVMSWVAQGATIVGGCCETGPDHIRTIADRLRGAGHTIV